MTFDEADEIVLSYGKYWQYMGGKIQLFFGASMPESFLPYPIIVLEEAIEIMVNHYIKIGDMRLENNLRNLAVLLLLFKDDEQALMETIETYSDPVRRKAMLEHFKIFQNDCIAMEKDFNDRKAKGKIITR